MHRTVNGADSIITLRCTQASSQREAICNYRHNQTDIRSRLTCPHHQMILITYKSDVHPGAGTGRVSAQLAWSPL